LDDYHSTEPSGAIRFRRVQGLVLIALRVEQVLCFVFFGVRGRIWAGGTYDTKNRAADSP